MQNIWELKKTIDNLLELGYSPSIPVSFDGRDIDIVCLREAPYISGGYVLEIKSKEGE